jgi:peptide/nickel transport system permease protein
MRLTDAFLAFPLAAMLMVALVALPLSKLSIVVLTFIVFGWMSYARLVRGNLLVEREKEYVQAARAIGVPRRRLIARHLFPNATHGLFVLMASDMGAVVLLVAAFTFIRLIGNESGGLLGADWGQMLSTSRNWIIGAPDRAFHYWYTYLPVSLAIVLFSVGWNLVGDGLRDVLDPRLH